MLLKDFYTVLHRSGPEEETSSTGVTSAVYRFGIELNPEHPVYAGHFSGNPVVPGVCQIQIIIELLSLLTGSDLNLVHADNVKFLSLIVPGKNRVIAAEIRMRTAENGEITASASLRDGETTFLKFKGLFKKEDS
jgi:3-hydroxyacyl-[acyl-carrier-protein] dehydratase